MVLVNTLLPGCSYSAGVFSIPVTALNAILANDITAADSGERLVYGLLQALYERQTANLLTQPTGAVEISAKSSTSDGVWELTTNNFTTCTTISYLVTFPFSSSTLENGNNISVI